MKRLQSAVSLRPVLTKPIRRLSARDELHSSVSLRDLRSKCGIYFSDSLRSHCEVQTDIRATWFNIRANPLLLTAVLHAGKHTKSVCQNETLARHRRWTNYFTLVHHTFYDRLQSRTVNLSGVTTWIPVHHTESFELRRSKGAYENFNVLVKLRAW